MEEIDKVVNNAVENMAMAQVREALDILMKGLEPIICARGNLISYIRESDQSHLENAKALILSGMVNLKCASELLAFNLDQK